MRVFATCQQQRMGETQSCIPRLCTICWWWQRIGCSAGKVDEEPQILHHPRRKTCEPPSILGRLSSEVGPSRKPEERGVAGLHQLVCLSLGAGTGAGSINWKSEEAQEGYFLEADMLVWGSTLASTLPLWFQQAAGFSWAGERSRLAAV